ncbi:chaperone DnaJ-domain superfamily protein isoform X2 [Wolffia australiana]
MARKGNQQKNGLHNGTKSDDLGKPPLDGSDSSRKKKNSKRTDGADFISRPNGAETREHDSYERHVGEKDTLAGKSSVATPGGSLTALIVYVLGVTTEWLYGSWKLMLVRLEHGYPIVLTWISHMGKLGFMLFMVWLDCFVRGLDSLVCLGSTSLFMVIWCTLFSAAAMIGLSKLFTMGVITGLVFIFIGLPLAVILLGISSIAILWIYGSFWTTGLVVFFGGISFATNHERISLFIAVTYSVYSAKGYIGWLGLFLVFNLASFSVETLVYLLKNKIENQRSSEPEHASSQSSTGEDQSTQDTWHKSSVDDAFFRSSDRGPGVPSTSGADSELTSEEEIVRLLNCSDHYSVLGLPRYEAIDASYLKKEYRKKAMLVHPDKNMGNEKAVEAFKKLQNAYEVLLDSLKRKTYDDELRREELLNYIRRLQTSSQKKGKHGIFTSGSLHPMAEEESASRGESRRISCKKCGDFHIWSPAPRSKSRARWCQECKDLHPAKDGDGWVEQSFQPLLFGLLHKMEPQVAYVCANSKIYIATEWFLCQGMSCAANTHKPSFHVNTTNVGSAARHGSAGKAAGGVEQQPMTEEEFFEWLQSAVQSGAFDVPSDGEGASPGKRGGSASRANPKKKKKARKQW